MTILRTRLLSGAELTGTFIKTPHPIVVEVMARTGLDLLILDAEHAPFDRTTIDACLIAGRVAGVPLLVRVPSQAPEHLQGALDGGAAGVLVPHVNSAAEAEALVRATRYGPGGRGFAATTRAAEYGGRTIPEHLAADPPLLICQIEDPPGAGAAAEIAAVEGVDALFVGRADLAVGTGHADMRAPEVLETTRRVLSLPVATGLYCAPGEDLAPHRAAGARLFVIGSDHTAMLRGTG